MLQQGTIIDRYQIQALLGVGGMGQVYRVQHTILGSTHALKVLTVHSKIVGERLIREGQVQAGLRNPHIVGVTDVVDIDGTPGLVMELVDGPDLKRVLEHIPLSLEARDGLARGILDGVAAAHAAGLVHRDLKPSNVLVEIADGHLIPRITDFGIAKVAGEGTGEDLTLTGQLMGTPSYLAPEQARNAKGVDLRADLFSLGAILYELLSGQRAFRGTDIFQVLLQISEGAHVPLDEVAPDALPSMQEAVTAALVTDPAARVQTCEALRALWCADLPDPRPGCWTPDLIQQVRRLVVEAEITAGTTASMSETWGSLAPVDEAPQTQIQPSVDPDRLREEARSIVLPVSIGLIVVGVLNWVAFVSSILLMSVLEHESEGLLYAMIVSVTLSLVTMLGGHRMMYLYNRRLAQAASVSAMVASPANLIGFPIGIWALTTLSRPAVVAAFARVAAEDAPTADATPGHALHPGAPSELDSTPERDAQIVEAGAAPDKPGGVFRRVAALAIDVLVFSILLTPIHLAMGPETGAIFAEITLEESVEGAVAEPHRLTIASLNLSDEGWTLLGTNGERATFADEGVTLTRPGQPEVVLPHAYVHIGATPWLSMLVFLGVTYCTVFLFWFAATPGKQALSLRVIDRDRPSERISLTKALLRSAFSTVSFSVCGLGYLWALPHSERVTWHDAVSRTRVVHRPRS